MKFTVAGFGFTSLGDFFSLYSRLTLSRKFALHQSMSSSTSLFCSSASRWSISSRVAVSLWFAASPIP